LANYSLTTERTLTEQNLIKDFGKGTPFAKSHIPALYRALTAELAKEGANRTKALYEQWVNMFQEVCNYQESSNKLAEYIQKVGFSSRDKVEPGPFFFSVHTYYATLIKLLAVQTVHYYLTELGRSLKSIFAKSDEELRDYMLHLENGELFRTLGIGNFLEGDFFGWYLDAWNDEIVKYVRELIRILSDYSLVTLDVNPEMTRDLLKHLYQNLMPKDIRHNLGEYYTPDWIAERLLNQLTVDGPEEDPTIDPKIRLLDPACGSGTFLVIAIKRMRRWGKLNPIPEEDLLEKILLNVVGFDLNPLAVITARTNYLLALGELLKARNTEITIPVFLCDSILTPHQKQDLYEKGAYRFRTSVGDFLVPTLLVSKGKINELADLIEESVKNRLETDAFLRKATARFGIGDKPGEDLRTRNVLKELYEKFLELEDKGINGIWARVIKNAFAPLFVGQFDCVMGNPPWVNWEHLPEGYRELIKGLWRDYGLAPKKCRGLGEVKGDISALMTYVALDKYLKREGKLGFVITQSVFKSGASKGFRRFILGKSGEPIKVIQVDDMVELKPFESAKNRTAVVVMQKGFPTKYPVNYYLWKKAIKGSIPTDALLAEVRGRVEVVELKAEPVDEKDITSPWITGKPKALKAVKKVLGRSEYVAHAGVCTWANSVYWVNIVQKRPDGLVIVSNITEGQKRKVKNVQAALEPDLLYPLLRGRDVQKWHAEPSAWIIVPQDPEDPSRVYPEERLKSDYPKCYAYLKNFEEILRSRSGYQQLLSKREKEFYGLMDISHYSFAPWKVVWRGVGVDITAAVVGLWRGELTEEKAILPIESVTMIPLLSEQEAHYVCAVINSSPWRFAINSSSVPGTGGFGSPKVLNKALVPTFNPQNKTHLRLSELSAAAHEAAKAGNQERVREIEEEIDRLSAELWGLDNSELAEIKKSLEEM